MNARTETAAPAVDLLHLSSIAPSQTHIQQLRRKRFNQDALAELADSIKKVGQLQPIVVRRCAPMMHNGAKFEIVLGERRFLACQLAGKADVLATIRELNDAEVLEAQLIENLQREDLHPLEEAEGYRELMGAAGIKKEALGERIGKSRSWVYSRLKLLDLQPQVREALEAGQIDVSRAMVLARIGDPVHQVKALEKATMRDNDGDYIYSVRDLRGQLDMEGFTISLKLAPFDTTAAGLNPERGACAGCEYRSGNNDPEAPDPDVCTDRSCYEKKSKAHGARRLAEAAAKGQEVLRGEAAKAISAGRDRYVGYVDIDTPCDFDEFSEPEPKLAKGVRPDDDPAWCAWDDRSNNWQPRTYRQLLGAQPWPFTTTLMEGPKKRVIELAPFKDLQLLLKKSDIKLPAHIASKPEPVTRQPAVDWKAQQAKQEEARKKKEEAEKRERAWKIPVFAAIVASKPPAKFAPGELRSIAELALDDWSITNSMRVAGFKFPDLKKATDEQIIRALRLSLVVVDITHDGPPDELLALAKSCKVDVAKIKREAEAKDKPAPAKKKGK